MSIPSDAEHLMHQGIAALKAGDKTKASDLLARSLQFNPRNEQAWLWLSGAVATDNHRRYCLQRVLEINPNNTAAQRGMQQLSAPAANPAQHPPSSAANPQVPQVTSSPGNVDQAARPAQPHESPLVSAASSAPAIQTQAQQPSPTPIGHPMPEQHAHPGVQAAQSEPEASAPAIPPAWTAPSSTPQQPAATGTTQKLGVTGTTTRLNRFDPPQETLADVLGLTIPPNDPVAPKTHSPASEVASPILPPVPSQPHKPLPPPAADPLHISGSPGALRAAVMPQPTVMPSIGVQIAQVVFLIMLFASIGFLIYETAWLFGL